MQLGLNIGYWSRRQELADLLALTREAEQLGFAVCWVAEAYGSDAATTLAWLASQTSRIGLGSGVFQIPARSPAMTAMTAASLDALSGGRFRLGLGVSGPQVSEGWHGVRFAKPLARTREYVDVVRTALAGKPVTANGEHYPLPLPGGAGKALRLAFHPVRTQVPIYLAAIGPANLRLTGEIADGWLAIFFSPDHAAGWLAEIAGGQASSPHASRRHPSRRRRLRALSATQHLTSRPALTSTRPYRSWSATISTRARTRSAITLLSTSAAWAVATRTSTTSSPAGWALTKPPTRSRHVTSRRNTEGRSGGASRRSTRPRFSAQPIASPIGCVPLPRQASPRCR